MCRWLAYSGESVTLDELIFKTEVSLIEQSLAARRADRPTNGDGFGIGWYGRGVDPGVYRCIRPAWNDENLRDLSAHIESSLFLAHVRAATEGVAVQRSNCHPFRHGRWLFVHNGSIEDFQRVRRSLTMAVAPEFYGEIGGTTDSELMFYLALTLGLESEPWPALQKMVGLIERTGRENGIDAPIRMTVGLCDGNRVLAARYSSAGNSPTLFYNATGRALEEITTRAPRFAGNARTIVSEPLTDLTEAWVEIPESTAVVLSGGEITTSPFGPQ